MIKTTASEKFLKAVASCGEAPFSTADFIIEFKRIAPKEWKEKIKEYGMGGKGAKKPYSAFVNVAQTLDRMSREKRLFKLKYRASPEGWGSPVIRYWRAVPSEADLVLFPDEAHDVFEEGAMTRVLVNRYERNPKARQECVNHYGAVCQGCDLDFRERYGPRGDGFIHVHHLKKISECKKTYKIDPAADLAPVCPNCHAMIHAQEPMLTIESLRAIIAKFAK